MDGGGREGGMREGCPGEEEEERWRLTESGKGKELEIKLVKKERRNKELRREGKIGGREGKRRVNIRCNKKKNR